MNSCKFNKNYLQKKDNKNFCFPYYFIKRKKWLAQGINDISHDILHNGRIDVAFDVEWTTKTPSALNPCIDDAIQACNPHDQLGQKYKGNNRRWYMPGDRLAISPFTVKSAVANSFAALMGGCYRVNTREIGHTKLDPGQYPYTGKWKRYRVSRSSSKSGVIVSLNLSSAEISIKPVDIFYFIHNKSSQLIPEVGKSYTGIVNKRYLEEIKLCDYSAHNLYICAGTYCRGMNLRLNDSNKSQIRYIFYKDSHKKELYGKLPIKSFETIDKLKKIVYAGSFKERGTKSSFDGQPWYENLNDLKTGSLIYYQEFNGTITSIGKCFSFKALFNQEDAVPKDQKACSSFQKLCPRCSLFGVINKEKEQGAPAGFRGRFKSSALVNESPLSQIQVTDQNPEGVKVNILSWGDGSGEKARQVLLPLQMPPKANKRDINGYYGHDGMIKGAKSYRHGLRNERLSDLSKIFTNYVQRGNCEKPSHHLRSWAMVCAPGIIFRGTLGVENCALKELGALLMVLDQRFTGHAFKLGLAKAYGFGSFSPSIRAIWMREPRDYQWRKINIGCDDEISVIISKLGQISHEVDQFIKQLNAASSSNLNPLRPQMNLEYPNAGPSYWKQMCPSP
ncbi:hypothetical protein M7784_07525 [Desulfovibrio aminophilus]|nr:hypothetical protein [Desulfovibrio aminophilus]MCM0755097.1 hypothetical protein [Desulfovibrio aminophilus]